MPVTGDLMIEIDDRGLPVRPNRRPAERIHYRGGTTFILKRMLGATAAVAVAASLLAPTAASAAVSDVAAAQLTNSLDQAFAMQAATDPNVTCDVEAGGRDLVQHTNYVFGEVYGTDFGIASGECVSLDTGRRFSVSLSVSIEYFTATGLTSGYWSSTGCGSGTSATSTSGVAVPLPATTTCTYPGTSGYLNRYHRAHATLTTSIAGSSPRHAYSPIWFMAP